MSLLAPYVDGVNCKLEKCGGLRFGVEALRAAKEAGMLVRGLKQCLILFVQNSSEPL